MKLTQKLRVVGQVGRFGLFPFYREKIFPIRFVRYEIHPFSLPNAVHFFRKYAVFENAFANLFVEMRHHGIKSVCEAIQKVVAERREQRDIRRNRAVARTVRAGTDEIFGKFVAQTLSRKLGKAKLAHWQNFAFCVV